MEDAMTLEQPETPQQQPFVPKSSGKPKRMKFSAAVRAELGKWRISAEDKAMVMMFCALVGMRMSGEDVEAFVNGPTVERKSA